jgi:germination protein M
MSTSKKNSQKVLFVILGTLILLIVAAGVIYYYQPFKSLLPVRKKPFSPLPPAITAKEKREVVVFFSDYTSDRLLPESREIYLTKDLVSQAKHLVYELIKGPNSELDPTIPRGTRLRELYLDQEGTAYVDFSRELVDNHWGGSSGESHTIYSIVNSLILNFPEIKRVQILIEGEKIETLAGHIDTRRPFGVNRDIIAGPTLPEK